VFRYGFDAQVSCSLQLLAAHAGECWLERGFEVIDSIFSQSLWFATFICGLEEGHTSVRKNIKQGATP